MTVAPRLALTARRPLSTILGVVGLSLVALGWEMAVFHANADGRTDALPPWLGAAHLFGAGLTVAGWALMRRRSTLVRAALGLFFGVGWYAFWLAIYAQAAIRA